MSLTRDQLAGTFEQLEAELIKLENEGQPEGALWEAFERLAQVPSHMIDSHDRLWWWEQLYSAMERHHLTELSRGQVSEASLR